MKLVKIYGGYKNTSDVINSMQRHREEVSSGENSHRKTKRSSSRL